MHVTYFRGVVLATLAAGPMAVIPYALVDPTQFSTEDITESLPATMLFLLLATVIGIVVSLVPNLIGTSLLAHVGRRTAWARQPLVWAMTGAALGCLMGVSVSGSNGNLVVEIALAALGIACALICRWGTRWHD